MSSCSSSEETLCFGGASTPPRRARAKSPTVRCTSPLQTDPAMLCVSVSASGCRLASGRPSVRGVVYCRDLGAQGCDSRRVAPRAGELAAQGVGIRAGVLEEHGLGIMSSCAWLIANSVGCT